VSGAVSGTFNARRAARTCCSQIFPRIAVSAITTTEYGVDLASNVRHGGRARAQAGFRYAASDMELSGCSALTT
jgi:hypothetical protein